MDNKDCVLCSNNKKICQHNYCKFCRCYNYHKDGKCIICDPPKLCYQCIQETNERREEIRKFNEEEDKVEPFGVFMLSSSSGRYTSYSEDEMEFFK